MTLLDGSKVLELAGPYGSTAARFLASLGADVTKVFLAGLSARAPDGAYARCEDADKEALRLDPTRAEDALRLHTLIGESDFLIESLAHDARVAHGLAPAALAAEHPRLVHASITPFGTDGPHARWTGEELVAAATGGVLRLVGEPGHPPVKEALDACGFHASAAAAAGMLLAHHARSACGLGQHVDVSVQEVTASRLTSAVLLWQFDRRALTRTGHAISYGRATVRCLWRLADGWVFHSLMNGKFGAPANQGLSDWMDACGAPNPLRGIDWGSYDRGALSADVRAVWEAAIAAFFAARTRREVETEGRRRGINASVLHAPDDVLADPQLGARGFFRDVVCDGAPVRLPGRFLHVHAPAPSEAPRTGPRARPNGEHGALAGVNVLDLSWALVGSLTTKALADHGACVVKVESATRPCLTRSDAQVAASTRASLDDKPWFAHLNTGKLSLRLNLKHPRARALLDPLLAWADVLVENFSPGTMEKLGLDYPRLQQTRPDLIMVSGSIYGQSGPRAHDWGVDGTGAALSGRTFLTGYPDGPPVMPGAVPYGDVVMPQLMVGALGAALAARRRTGRGCHLDAAMVEICAQQMGGALLDAQQGRAPARGGNRDPRCLVQGVYPARGEDRWIALSVFDADAWRRAAAVLGGGFPDASVVAALDDAGRHALDRRIGAVTARHADHDLVRALQTRGVAAGVVQTAEDLLERDPQLAHRGALEPLTHPVLGRFAHQRTPYTLSRTPARLRPAPRIGEHTERVCRELLGLDDALWASLAAEPELFF